MVAYYSARAAEYERVYQKPERQADLQTLRTFVEKFFAGCDVLELACGTGYWTASLARSANSVLATDITDEVLTVARVKNLGNNVRFSRANAYALPPSLGRFDAAMAAFWWSHIPKWRLSSFLQSFHQALSPAARVVFIDNVYVQGSSTPISRMDEHGDTYQVRRLDDNSTHEVRKNFPTERELRDAVEPLASDIQVQWLQYYWILSYRLGRRPA